MILFSKLFSCRGILFWRDFNEIASAVSLRIFFKGQYIFPINRHCAKTRGSRDSVQHYESRRVKITSTTKLRKKDATGRLFFHPHLPAAVAAEGHSSASSIHPRVNSVNRGCLNFHIAPPFRSLRRLTCEKIYVPKEYAVVLFHPFLHAFAMLLHTFHKPTPFYHHILSYFSAQEKIPRAWKRKRNFKIYIMYAHRPTYGGFYLTYIVTPTYDQCKETSA